MGVRSTGDCKLPIAVWCSKGDEIKTTEKSLVALSAKVRQRLGQ